jgi:hypothetical protein
VLLDEIVEVIEDLPLTLGQWQHGRMICKEKAKVNAIIRLTFASALRSNAVRHAYNTRMVPLDGISRARLEGDGDEPD